MSFSFHSSYFFACLACNRCWNRCSLALYYRTCETLPVSARLPCYQREPTQPTGLPFLGPGHASSSNTLHTPHSLSRFRSRSLLFFQWLELMNSLRRCRVRVYEFTQEMLRESEACISTLAVFLVTI